LPGSYPTGTCAHCGVGVNQGVGTDERLHNQDYNATTNTGLGTGDQQQHDGFVANHPTATGAAAGAGLGAGAGLYERREDRRDAQNLNAIAQNNAGAGGQYVDGSNAAYGGTGSAGTGGMGTASGAGVGALGVGAADATGHHYGRGGAGNVDNTHYDTGAGEFTGASGQTGQTACIASANPNNAGTAPIAGHGQARRAHSGNAAGQKIMGRMEQAIGTVLSSESMKAHGREREKEGIAQQDMNEAQRLDTLAANHRAMAGANRGTGTGAIGY